MGYGQARQEAINNRTANKTVQAVLQAPRGEPVELGLIARANLVNRTLIF